jgi:MFS family permease
MLPQHGGTEKRMENSLIYPKSRWFVMAVVFVNYMAAGSLIVVFSPSVGLIAEEFGVTVGQMTFYGIALYSLVNAFFTIISGFLIDRFGLKPVMLAGALIMAVTGLLLSVLCRSVAGIIVFRILLGIGAGPASACLAPVAGRWFPMRERGRYNGIAGSGLSVGILITFSITGMRLGATGGDWRAAAYTIMLIPVAALIFNIVMIITTRKTVLPEQEPGSIESIAKTQNMFKSIIKAPVFWLIIIAFACYFMAADSFTEMVPGYTAIDPPMGVGRGAEMAAYVATLIAIGRICGVNIDGTEAYGDRFGERRSGARLSDRH